MARKTATPPPKRRKPKDIPANAKLDTFEMYEVGQSYNISVYFTHPNGDYGLRLKVAKRTDLGRQFTAVIEAVKVHPKRKV